MRHAVTAAWILTLSVAAPVSAQRGPQLGVAVVPGSPPNVTARRMLSNGKTRELLLNGFPAYMTFRLESWRVGGLFDNLEGSQQWNVLVRYDAYSKTYVFVRRGMRELEASQPFTSVDSVEAAIGLPLPIALAPQRKNENYYYNLIVDTQTLSFTDLDELNRWLNGEVQPAVRGKRDPVSALWRGIGTLLSRMLGGERQHYEARSITFRAE